MFLYKKPGAFFHVNEEISKKVIDLFENEPSSKFDIISKTYRIRATLNQNDNKESIITNNKRKLEKFVRELKKDGYVERTLQLR